MIRQGRISEVPDVANNELIRRISEQRVNLRAEIALQSRTLLPGHPRMQELNAQLQDIDNQLRAAGEKAVRTLENDARIAASRVDNLSAALDVQKKTASTAGADQVELNRLELQARLLKDQLEFNTSKYQDALARESAGSTPADARVISRADPPQQPTFPKKLPIIAIMTLAGLVLSTAILIARELLSGRVFTADRVEPVPARRIEPTPALEPVPVPVPVSRELVSPEEIASPSPQQPHPVVRDGEPDVVLALRELRSRAAPAMATRVLVTAPSAGDETAVAAVALARQLAGQARTIMVDFDRDAPALGSLQVASITPDRMGPELAGLSELMSGEATFAEIIHRDSLSRLHVVPVGRGILPDDEGSDFGLVLDALAETYEFVLMHAPSPRHSVTRALSAATDAAVLLRPDGVSEGDLQAARVQLEERGPAPVYTVSASVLAAAGPVRDAA